MSDIRETEIERDHEGRVIAERERRVENPPKTGGLAAVLFTLVLIGGGIAAFAYSQGSFENAGADADRFAAEAEQQTGNAIESARGMLETDEPNRGDPPVDQPAEPAPPADMNDLPDQPAAPN